MLQQPPETHTSCHFCEKWNALLSCQAGEALGRVQRWTLQASGQPGHSLLQACSKGWEEDEVSRASGQVCAPAACAP